MTAHERIAAQAAEIRRLNELVDKLWPGVGSFSESHAEAAAQFNAAVRALDDKYEDAAARAREGDRGAINDATEFLEARPECHRSGYIAENLMRALSRAPLSPSEQARLRDVVVAEASRSWTRGSAHIGALAGAVWNPELEATLNALAERQGKGSNRAAKIVEAAQHWLASAAGATGPQESKAR